MTLPARGRWTDWIIPVCALIAITWLIVGCQTPNPVTTAKDPLQRAYALYGEFVIVEEEAARLKTSGTLTGDALVIVQRADAKAKPGADAILQAIQQYAAAENSLAGAPDTAGKVALASAQVQRWVTEAQGDITAFVNAVHAK